MPISDFHASIITHVSVAFILSHPDLDPDAVTKSVGIIPARSARRGDPRLNPVGKPRAPWPTGQWRIESRDRVDSKDINVHLDALLAVLLPRQESFRAFASGGAASFDVYWCSTYLYAGTGPLISAACLQGVAALGADLAFDIRQVDDPSALGA